MLLNVSLRSGEAIHPQRTTTGAMPRRYPIGASTVGEGTR